MKNSWKIVDDCNSENGEPTCWSRQIDNDKYGKFVWITLNSNGLYDIEIFIEGNFRIVATCKTLVDAKRWASANLL